MACIFDWIATFFIWIGFSFISHCIENTRLRQRAVVKKNIRVEPDVLGTRKGTVSNTRQSTTSADSYNSLIKKLAEKGNVAVENQDLKIQVTKLQIELALSDSKIRKLKNAQNELAASRCSMEARLLTLERENLTLINKESKLRQIIEDKDRLLDVVSLLSSDNTPDCIGNLFDNNLIGLDEKNKEVRRLLAESKKAKPMSSDVECGSKEPIPATVDDVEVSITSTDETLVEELYQSTPDSDNGVKGLTDYSPPKGLWWTSANTRRTNQKRQLQMPGADFPPFVPEVIVMDRVLPPPTKSPAFVDNRKMPDVEYLLLTNLPPSVHGADIVEHFELMVGDVEQYTMFADENGHYSGSMGVVFVHPPDTRRAYKTYDGMLFEGHNQLWYKVEVAYFTNGQRSYQKEKDSATAATDGVFVADWINASTVIAYATSVSETVAVHQQPQDTSQGAIAEENQQTTTTTNLEDSVEVKNLEEDSLSCETNPPLIRKQKINNRTSRRKKAKKNREAASSAE